MKVLNPIKSNKSFFSLIYMFQGSLQGSSVKGEVILCTVIYGNIYYYGTMELNTTGLYIPFFHWKYSIAYSCFVSSLQNNEVTHGSVPRFFTINSLF
ncbi:uncharacterized protein Gasu_28680 [Galdieria sulphuraria]|uniref:Uncharacterized protein n=1 Tax=Galdieria sulphuraria TaxID=130081 RepID=M2Y243_GALSU|nr:uncharacterized protein Gasu_28680 [Galdieria sulphuraria]EME29874.1 hypothetical protein Gasu_28680 [Galdieria sulphuraria]|eukprot:XP_005706394.1 hypothetical protein Gasu_28680 [Galdieria sulphuraria]